MRAKKSMGEHLLCAELGPHIHKHTWELNDLSFTAYWFRIWRYDITFPIPVEMAELKSPNRDRAPEKDFSNREQKAISCPRWFPSSNK